MVKKKKKSAGHSQIATHDAVKKKLQEFLFFRVMLTALRVPISPINPFIAP